MIKEQTYLVKIQIDCFTQNLKNIKRETGK